MSKEATLDDVLARHAHLIKTSIRTALPARVMSFNTQANTVEVEVMINQVLADGSESELPLLVDVPVDFPRGGGFVLTFPIKKGDEGWVIFADRCIDGWWATGEKSAPLEPRLHDYSDAAFIPGISSKPRAIKSIYMDGISMRTEDDSTYIRLTNGVIYVKGKIMHDGDHEQTGNMKREGTSDTSGQITGAGGMSIKGGNGTSIEGDMTHTNGSMTSNGVSLDGHTHSGVQTGSGNTGKPNK